MDGQPPQPLHGDRPIGPRDQDELGFGPIAKRIAEAIQHQAASAGLVVALEGRWGSGKSSLVNLVAGHLAHNGEHGPIVVRFEPWLIGDRDALLSDLFTELSAAVAQIEGPSKTAADRAVGGAISVAERMRSFAGRLGGIGKVVEIAGTLGVPAAGAIGKLLQDSAEAANAVEPRTSVAETKSQLDEALAALGRRIVVIIDDLDRLEPQETCEIVRLVRAVANFPNVVYILCFDPEVVAHNIQAGLSVANGQAYLEKIVQVSVSVPLPEPFDLRRWFSRELSSFASCDEEVAQRLALVIDTEGGQRLRTPRHVTRALNALRLVWPSLVGRVDLADLTWLQLLRVSNPDLYRWVENYMREMAAKQEGARISEIDQRRMYSDLKVVLAKDELTFSDFSWGLVEILPGVERVVDPEAESEPPIARTVREDETRRSVAAKRIASPQHYRLYFSLELPAGTLTDDEHESFIAAAEASEAGAIEALGALIDAVRPQGGSKADLALDRLRGNARLSKRLCNNLLVALAEHMDRAAIQEGRGDWGQYGIWRLATNLLPLLAKRLSGNMRKALLRRIFSSGKSIGWLTTVFRDEIFAHGRYGAREKPIESRALLAAEFDVVANEMLKRYASEPVATLRSAPILLNILFAWHQAGGAEDVSDWAARATETDADLLLTLEAMRSWQASNGRIQYPLVRRNVSPFLDFDVVRQRLETIAQRGATELRTRASLLLLALKDEEL